jgi:proteic killer suppression protein
VGQGSEFPGQALEGWNIVARMARQRLEPLGLADRKLHCRLHLTSLGSCSTITLRVKVSRRMVIEISWSSRRLEKACSDDRHGQRQWGADNWKIFKRRLVALLGAPTLADMEDSPGRCHQLHADRAGDFGISLWGSYRLIFQPAHDPLPILKDGGVDTTLVTKIEIKEVVDYHGN